VHERWVTNCRSIMDTRTVYLLLSRQGNALALHIEQRVRHVKTTLTEQERRALGMNSKGPRA
jgi:hypothetical protein